MVKNVYQNDFWRHTAWPCSCGNNCCTWKRESFFFGCYVFSSHPPFISFTISFFPHFFFFLLLDQSHFHVGNSVRHFNLLFSFKLLIGCRNVPPPIKITQGVFFFFKKHVFLGPTLAPLNLTLRFIHNENIQY